MCAGTRAIASMKELLYFDSSLKQVRTDYYRFVNKEVKRFVSSVLGEDVPKQLYWLNTSDTLQLKNVIGNYNGVANLQRVNDIQRINKHFEANNDLLASGDYHIICLETKDQRKRRLLSKYPAVVNHLYYSIDFIFKRFFPKWEPTKKLYFSITKGRNRVLSLTEALGRLESCGFKIVDYEEIGSLTYVISKKSGKPVYPMAPTYGPFCKLHRIGKDGKPIEVYKLRTMHPYSEFLQEFMYKRNDLQEGGKIRDDIRVTSWGKWFRKLWIDELPMLYNWIKGEMKCVGVRPLSRHYFALYPREVQELRKKVKPGLLPPFYADMPKTLDEIIESEKTYLIDYLHKPLRTDFKYFFKALYNIFIKGARSN